MSAHPPHLDLPAVGTSADLAGVARVPCGDDRRRFRDLLDDVRIRSAISPLRDAPERMKAVAGRTGCNEFVLRRAT